jgi:hypothetical protein
VDGARNARAAEAVSLTQNSRGIWYFVQARATSKGGKFIDRHQLGRRRRSRYGRRQERLLVEIGKAIMGAMEKRRSRDIAVFLFIHWQGGKKIFSKQPLAQSPIINGRAPEKTRGARGVDVSAYLSH